jgi:cell division protein FtsL
MVVAETVKRQHVAKKAVGARNRRIKLFSFLMLVFLCMALVYVWTRISVVQKGYEVSRLHNDAMVLTEQKSRLEAEVMKLKSPARLEAIARDKLGMRLPNGSEIVFIEP